MGGCEFGNNGNMSVAPSAPGGVHILLFSTIGTRPVVDAVKNLILSAMTVKEPIC